MQQAEPDQPKKVLLMGRSGAGKTSMRSIIFANQLARDAYRQTFTNQVSKSAVKFLGNLTISLWDCGGQDKFIEQYFQSQRDEIFQNVKVLIYVFDVASKTFPRDLSYYDFCLQALADLSPQTQVFCLVHKMDLVSSDLRNHVYQEKKDLIWERTKGFQLACFPTSIWDDSLYRAWSDIVHFLLPNTQTLEKSLGQFCGTLGAEEVVLFERNSFLVVAHHNLAGKGDGLKFEMVSNIIKQFKLSCVKTNYQLGSMLVRNNQFRVFINLFTSSTYLMVILRDPAVDEEAVNLNIKATKDYFEQLVLKA